MARKKDLEWLSSWLGHFGRFFFGGIYTYIYVHLSKKGMLGQVRFSKDDKKRRGGRGEVGKYQSISWISR